MPKKKKAVATVTMANGTFTGKGDTIDEALQNVPLDLLKIKTKGMVRIEEAGKSYEQVFHFQPLRRLFRNRISKTHYAYQAQKFLK